MHHNTKEKRMKATQRGGQARWEGRWSALVFLGAATMSLAWPGCAGAEAPSPVFRVPLSAEAASAAAALRLVPLQDDDAMDTSRSRCNAVILSESGERLAVSAGSALLVRLSVPFEVDNAAKVPASPQVTFWLGDRVGSWGRYKSKGHHYGGFQTRRQHYSLVLNLNVSNRTDCPAEKGGLCETSKGTLELGYTPPDAPPPGDSEEEESLYRVTHKTPVQRITLKEQCDAPNGERFYDGLVAHRSVLETAAGLLFVLMGGSR